MIPSKVTKVFSIQSQSIRQYFGSSSGSSSLPMAFVTYINHEPTSFHLHRSPIQKHKVSPLFMLWKENEGIKPYCHARTPLVHRFQWNKKFSSGQSTTTTCRWMATSSRSNGGTTTNSTSIDATYDPDDTISGYRPRVAVHWYPGHIAKAERQLKESFLKAVDVVVEVRDARIPKATSHPKVAEWCAGRPRLIVLTHMDHVPKNCQKGWIQNYNNKMQQNELCDVDKQILNQARQATREREKYRSSPNNDKSNKKEQENRGDSTASDNLVDLSNRFSTSPIQDVIYVNAKEGGPTIIALKKAILKAGQHVQEKRARRGLRERALRVGILGYPNVGKSALINRLLGRKRAKSANTPGVTRSLQWIRVRQDESAGRSGDFELLDSPGIIPVSFLKDSSEASQSDALLLAACNCIGDQSYDNQEVASYLCEWLLAMHRLGYGKKAAPQWPLLCQERYKFNPLQDKKIVHYTPPYLLDETKDDENNDDDIYYPRTGEDMLHDVAASSCHGDPEDAARKILQDFRAGRWGPICLQLAPESIQDSMAPILESTRGGGEREHRAAAQQAWEKERAQQRIEAAQLAAEKMGLQLPPRIQQPPKNDSEFTKQSTTTTSSDVGKGLFEGW